ncbi:Pupal cuticle protein 27, partial [Frankliniella fusca]
VCVHIIPKVVIPSRLYRVSRRIHDSVAGLLTHFGRKSRLLLLALLAASALAAVLAAPLPLRVHPVDEDEGAAADMGEGDDGDDASAEADSSATRPVAILEHRQELQDDGTFNYAFSADNGLTQNEAFHPDGSRTGSYSYVDPKGETILVKYRADRFGFHVLDGSSIPSTPPHTVNTPNAAPSAPRGASQQASSDYVSTMPLRPRHGHGLGKAKGLGPGPRPAKPRPRALL